MWDKGGRGRGDKAKEEKGETRAELMKEIVEYHIWEEKAWAMNVGEKSVTGSRDNGLECIIGERVKH